MKRLSEMTQIPSRVRPLCNSSLCNRFDASRAVHVGCSHGGCTSLQPHHWTHVAGDSPSGRRAFVVHRGSHDEITATSGSAQPSPHWIFLCTTLFISSPPEGGRVRSWVDSPTIQMWVASLGQFSPVGVLPQARLDEIVHATAFNTPKQTKHQLDTNHKIDTGLQKCIQFVLYSHSLLFLDTTCWNFILHQGSNLRSLILFTKNIMQEF